MRGVSSCKILLESFRRVLLIMRFDLQGDNQTVANISGHDVMTMLKQYAHRMDDAGVAAIVGCDYRISLDLPSTMAAQDGK